MLQYPRKSEISRCAGLNKTNNGMFIKIYLSNLLLDTIVCQHCKKDWDFSRHLSAENLKNIIIFEKNLDQH